MTPEERDGCIYCRAGVICRFPAIYGGVPPKCKCCGWNPAVEPARKEQVREKLRRRWKLAGGGATPSIASRSPSLKEGGKKGGGGDV